MLFKRLLAVRNLILSVITCVDVKAVTLHRFRLEQTAAGGETFVLVDV